MQNQNDLFSDEFIHPHVYRRKLLPWWMKVFIWIFLILGSIIPIAIVFGLLGYKFIISIYGLETSNPLSMLGSFLMAIFILKGIVSYGLWTGKKWAVNIGIFDAFIGILICIYAMFVYPIIGSGNESLFSFRLELLLLIPYLIKLLKIRTMWNQPTSKAIE